MNDRELTGYGGVFFFNDTATTEIYTLSLHDALPILGEREGGLGESTPEGDLEPLVLRDEQVLHELLCYCGSTLLDIPGSDRKSTRLNSSHANISYAVFCLKKKKSSLHLLNSHTLYVS